MERANNVKKVEVVAGLVKRCLNGTGLRRPTMKQVTKEFGRSKGLGDNFWVQQENEETECLLGRESSSYTFYEFSHTKMEQMETYTFHTTFEIYQAYVNCWHLASASTEKLQHLPKKC
ncbi:hypothetical protein SLE2022_123060 [Rubroshorea leprosula]